MRRERLAQAAEGAAPNGSAKLLGHSVAKRREHRNRDPPARKHSAVMASSDGQWFIFVTAGRRFLRCAAHPAP